MTAAVAQIFSQCLTRICLGFDLQKGGSEPTEHQYLLISSVFVELFILKIERIDSINEVRTHWRILAYFSNLIHVG